MCAVCEFILAIRAALSSALNVLAGKWMLLDVVLVAQPSPTASPRGVLLRDSIVRLDSRGGMLPKPAGEDVRATILPATPRTASRHAPGKSGVVSKNATGRPILGHFDALNPATAALPPVWARNSTGKPGKFGANLCWTLASGVLEFSQLRLQQAISERSL